MPRKFILLLIVAFLAIAGTDARAQSSNGGKFFARLNVGYDIAGDQTVPGFTSGVTAFAEQTIEYEDTFSFQGGLGYRFNRLLSVEAEIGYAAYEIESIAVGSNPSGEYSNLTFMTNLIAEFGKSRVKPYIGAGLGVAYLDVDNISYRQNNTTLTINGDTTVLAYQLIAGVGYKVTDNIAVGLDYRLFGIGDYEIAFGSANVDIETDISHRLGLQVKFTF